MKAVVNGKEVILGAPVAIRCRACQEKANGRIAQTNTETVAQGVVLSIKFELDEDDCVIWTAEGVFDVETSRPTQKGGGTFLAKRFLTFGPEVVV